MGSLAKRVGPRRRALVRGLVAALATLALGAAGEDGVRSSASGRLAALDWPPAAAVAVTADASRAPSIAVDDAGGAWIAWEEGIDVVAAHRAPGEAWSASERVAGGHAPSIAYVGGRAHVAFADQRGERVGIRYASRSASGWDLPRNVSTTLTALSGTPSLAVAGTWRAVAWSSGGALYLGRSADGNAWSVAPMIVGGAVVHGMAPSVAAHLDGSIDLAWQAAAGNGQPSAYLATWREGAWSLPEQLSEGGEAAEGPRLALAGDGLRHVAWRTAAGAALVLGSPGAFGWPEAVPGAEGAHGPIGIALGPTMPSGAEARVAWSVADGVWLARRSPAGTWASARLAAAAEPNDVALGASAAGLWATWAAPSGTWDVFARGGAEADLPVPSPPPPTPTRTATSAATASASATSSPPVDPTSTPTASATGATTTATATGATTTATATGATTTATAEPTNGGEPTGTPPTGTPTSEPTIIGSASPTTPGPGSSTPSPTGRPTEATATADLTATASPGVGSAVYLPFATNDAGAVRSAAAPARLVARGPAPRAGRGDANPPAADRNAAANGAHARRDGLPAEAERHAATYGARDGRGAVAPVGAPRPAADAARDGWHPARQLAESDAAAFAPSAAVAADGVRHVAWEAGGAVWHVAGDGPAVRVAAGDSPALAVAGDGIVHLLFANAFAGRRDIFHAWLGAGSWSLPQNVSATEAFSTGPALIAGGGGVLSAAWTELRAEPRIQVARWDGWAWHHAPVMAATGLGPDLAWQGGTPPGADAGALLLAYHARSVEGDRLAVFGMVRQAGAWSLPERISERPSVDATGATVVAGATGWHVAWREDDGSASALAYARRGAASWLPPEQLAAPIAGAPRLVGNPPLDRAVAWRAGGELWLAEGIGQVGWRRAPLPLGATDVTALDLATAEGGALHVAWTARAAGGGTVWAAERPAPARRGRTAFLPLAFAPR